MGVGGLVVLVMAVTAAIWPPVAAYPLAAISGWLALSLLVRAWRLWTRGRASASKK